ncbi:MAG: hypothetical protein KGL53_13735 [Elusimicrobia bacterium]|nr:hypothetical protein [Elusimicrobiota bacterium]
MNAAALAALLLAAPAKGADLLDRPLPSFSVTKAPLRQAVMGLIAKGMTAGVAVDPDTEPSVTVHLKATTRRKVLDALLAQSPGYAWSVSSGVVVVEPVSVSTSSPLAALGRKVSRFSVSGAAVPVAVRVLRAQAYKDGLPVQGMLMPSARQLKLLSSRTPPEDMVSVSLASVTLRDALDAVVRARPPSWWLAMPLRDGHLALMADSVELGGRGRPQ